MAYFTLIFRRLIGRIELRWKGLQNLIEITLHWRPSKNIKMWGERNWIGFGWFQRCDVTSQLIGVRLIWYRHLSDLSFPLLSELSHPSSQTTPTHRTINPGSHHLNLCTFSTRVTRQPITLHLRLLLLTLFTHFSPFLHHFLYYIIYIFLFFF